MLDFHSAVILASIEQTTLSATRRRKQSVWHWAALAVMSVVLALAVFAGLGR